MTSAGRVKCRDAASQELASASFPGRSPRDVKDQRPRSLDGADIVTSSLRTGYLIVPGGVSMGYLTIPYCTLLPNSGNISAAPFALPVFSPTPTPQLHRRGTGWDKEHPPCIAKDLHLGQSLPQGGKAKAINQPQIHPAW